jgi:hypothetical protein
MGDEWGMGGWTEEGPNTDRHVPQVRIVAEAVTLRVIIKLSLLFHGRIAVYQF